MVRGEAAIRRFQTSSQEFLASVCLFSYQLPHFRRPNSPLRRKLSASLYSGGRPCNLSDVRLAIVRRGCDPSPKRRNSQPEHTTQHPTLSAAPRPGRLRRQLRSGTQVCSCPSRKERRALGFGLPYAELQLNTLMPRFGSAWGP